MADSPGLALQPDPRRYALPAFLDDVAQRHAGRVALRFEDRTIAFDELRARARALARGLLAAGVVKGTRVGLLAANRPEWVVAAFATALAGGVLVPISTFATAAEREHLMRHGDVAVLLLEPALLKHRYLDDLLGAHPEIASGAPGAIRCPALPFLRRVVALGVDAPVGGVERWDDVVASGAGVPETLLDAAAREVAPGDEAMIVYTSGSTAEPKGVVHAHRAAVIQSWRFAEILDLAPHDVVWTAYPLFWTAGFAMSLGASLAAGSTLLLEETFDAPLALARIEETRATVVHAWPHQEKALAEHPSARHRDLRSLRQVNFGSPLAPLAGIREDRWGRAATYGLTETFTLVAAIPATAPVDERRGNHGRVLPGTEVRIVDPTSGSPLAAGETGEIWVRGATLMLGYHKQPREAAFDADGFFHTGDGGSLDADGKLHWNGRLTGLIKTGGANVSPVEIENQLRSFPGLRGALAVGVAHRSLGEIVVLCALVEPGVTPPTEDEIRGFLRARLASYKVPRRVLFFDVDEVAMTGTQKIQAAPLREAALARLRAERAVIDGEAYA
ncbi:MAG: AMP-binding protein [bacterium]